MNRRVSYVNIGIIIINLVYFIYIEYAGSSEDAADMLRYGALNGIKVVEEGEYYRLLTAVFMHFGIGHFINNMLILFVLGDNLERAFGSVKYLVLYLGCGIGANVASIYIPDFLQELAVSYPDMANALTGAFQIDYQYNSYVVSAGASGAIFGVIGGLLYAVSVNKGRLENLSGYQLVIVILFSLYFGYQNTAVNHVAHVAGLLLGILLAILLYRKPKGNMALDRL